MGKHYGTFLTDAEEDRFWMYLAALEKPVPPYDLVKALIMREIGLPYTPKPRQKTLGQFLRRLQQYKNRLAGARIASQRGLPAENGMNEASDLSPPVDAPVDGVSAKQSRAKALSGQSGGPAPVEEVEPEEPQPEGSGESPSEGSGEDDGEIKPHPSYVAIKGLYGRRRR